MSSGPDRSHSGHLKCSSTKMNGKLCSLVVVTFFCVFRCSASSMYRPVIDYLEDDNDPGDEQGDVYDTVEMGIDLEKIGYKVCQPGFCCPSHLECRSLFCYNPLTGNKMHSVLNC